MSFAPCPFSLLLGGFRWLKLQKRFAVLLQDAKVYTAKRHDILRDGGIFTASRTSYRFSIATFPILEDLR
ncbi:hypothetical protein KCU87_g55, partial [Aureobasidium melanogenum]